MEWAMPGRYYLLCSGQNFVVETNDFGAVKMCRHEPDGTTIELGVIPSIGQAVRFSGLDAGAKCFEFNEPIDQEDHEWASLDLD